MKKILLAAAMAAVAVSVSANAGDSKSERAAQRLAEFDRTGETASCIPIRRIQDIEPIDDSTFLVRVGRDDYYLNEVSSQCRRATIPNHRIQFKSELRNLCQTQIISIIDNGTGMTVGSCSLGEFERLESSGA